MIFWDIMMMVKVFCFKNNRLILWGFLHWQYIQLNLRDIVISIIFTILKSVFMIFLKHVKYKFKSSNKKWFKCSFNIENTQNSIRFDLEPLLNTRYWTTETYDNTYFNDFIFFGLRQDFLKRVIINNMSGSACHFKRFTYLVPKVLDAEVEVFH